MIVKVEQSLSSYLHLPLINNLQPLLAHCSTTVHSASPPQLSSVSALDFTLYLLRVVLHTLESALNSATVTQNSEFDE